MEKLIVIASLGRVRPLEYREGGDDPTQQAHLVEVPGRMIEMDLKSLSSVVTDQSGRFNQGAAAGRKSGMSYGDANHLEAEREKQALNRVADEIGKIVAEEGNPAWRLVAPNEIQRALTRALPATARKTLVHTESGDLTKCSIAELEKRIL